MSNNNNCIIPKIECTNSNIVKNFENILKEFRKKDGVNNLSTISPFSDKDLDTMEDALQKYYKECSLCASEGRNDYKCMEQVETNLLRRFPYDKNKIYPWKNYDWNYANYVTNNYSIKNTGATTDGSFDSLRKNANAFAKLVDGFIKDPIPNDLSKSAENNRNSDYPSINECNNSPMCRTTQKVRQNLSQDTPNKDTFFNKKVDGQYSSSYYFRVGSCPRDDITSEKKCNDMGYTWTPIDKTKGTGNCSMDRYAFVDNSPKSFFNGSDTKGLVTTMANDLSLLSPDKIFASLTGKSISDSYVIQPCPNINQEQIKENFEDLYKTENNNKTIYITGLLFVLLSSYIYFRK